MTEHSTLSEFISSQEELIQEAAEALPHQFSTCTYDLGHIRQAIYLCLTCPESRGLCSACSVACHTDHEQIELFPKRNFRCDCPTSSISHACSLHPKLESENLNNKYGQNFKALFCRCARPYDANKERETMIQCLVCEVGFFLVRCQSPTGSAHLHHRQDWFHESCCNLRERPSSREPSPSPEPHNPADNPADVDSRSEASSFGLPPPLIRADDYDSLICGSCVSSIHTLEGYAGTPGAMIVARENDSSPWAVWHRNEICADDADGITPTAGAAKRLPSPTNSSGEERPSKRSRISDDSSLSSLSDSTRTSVCLALPMNRRVQPLYTTEGPFTGDEALLGTGDLFLTEGFRDRWCRCPSCLPSLQSHPCLLTDEETYEPPEDPDSGLSLEELGLRALQRLPRDRAIDGIHAFNAMRDGLMDYLRPFAQDGKIVNESDIKSFFDDFKQGKQGKKDGT